MGQQSGKRVRWVLWERPKGHGKYRLRRGRYQSMEAAQDAIRHLRSSDLDMLAIPEGHEPQSNATVRA